MTLPNRPTAARSPLPHLAPAAVLAAALLGACIENEESIVVREDGSVRVTVRAEGDAPDLANGYPVPLDGPWQPANEDTRMWLRRVGSGPVTDAMALVAQDIHAERSEESVELELSAELPSVAALPAGYAPAEDPYATAYLERTTHVDVREEGGRRVFRFERVYRGRDYHRLDPYTRLEERDDELVSRFDDAETRYSEAEWEQLTRTVRRVFAEVAELYTRDAILGLYTEGDASLSPAALPALYDRVRASASELITVERLQKIRRLTTSKKGEEEAVARLLEELQSELRAGIRRELRLALEAGDVREPVRNALLYALEWNFTAQDAYGELLDETFRLTVLLPGTLVGGNFDDTEGQLALWEFDGDALLGSDLVLRATSVLE